MRTCFFIGHRDASDSLGPSLADAVERHIAEYGVTEFVVGQYGNFDRLAASAVKTAKRRYPGITLTLLLPYYPVERAVPVPEGFDGTFYPPGMERVPRRFAIVRANRWVVEHCDFLIAYVRRRTSNAGEVLEYAETRKKRKLIHICNLNERK